MRPLRRTTSSHGILMAIAPTSRRTCKMLIAAVLQGCQLNKVIQERPDFTSMIQSCALS